VTFERAARAGVEGKRALAALREPGSREADRVCVCVYYCRTYYKAVRVGEEESGGHVL
jgi:hypothetical protein